jgi:tetratricopeptide (TPR) repeat protein
LLLEKVPLLILAVAACAIVVYAQNHARSLMSLEIYPLPLRLANSLDSTVEYLRQTIWPVDLAVFYPYPTSGVPPFRLAVDAAVLLGITAVALRTAWSRPYLLVGWLWYLVTLLPVIGLVQVGLQGHADRYTYIPHIGLFLSAVWGLTELLPQRRREWLLGGVALVVLLPCVWLTHQQIGYWKTSLALWEHTVAVTPNNSVAHLNYGNDLASVARYDEAAEQWEKVVGIDPTNEVVLVQLGKLYELQDQPEEALRYYRTALALQPKKVFYQELVKQMEQRESGAAVPR